MTTPSPQNRKEDAGATTVTTEASKAPAANTADGPENTTATEPAQPPPKKEEHKNIGNFTVGK